MSDSRLTVVSVPRERFSATRRSLESLFEHSTVPHDLICVDGGSPPRLRRWLEAEAERRGFRLLRRDRYLSPNEARNLGLSEARTEFVVFVDNDVVASPGWLEKLVECADDTGADIVGPLTCIGEPLGETIHFAGGEVSIEERPSNGVVHRQVKERMWFPNRKRDALEDRLHRQRCELAEFHCMLARTDLFARIGPLDEEMLNTREHLDLCLEVARSGGSVWFEPESVVTYVPGPPFAVSDLPYYMLRWSDDWERRSLERFRAKWDLAEDEFFQARLRRLGWRRAKLLHGATRRVTFGHGRTLARGLRGPERLLNRSIAGRHSRRVARGRGV